MSRILFYSEAWGKGGIEAFIMNVLPLLVANGHRVDIFSTWDWEDQDDTRLNKLGVNRFTAFRGYRPGQLKRLIEGPRAFRGRLEAVSYDVVWINTMNGMGFQFAREAKRVGVPVRIVHSHNSDVGEGAKALKRAMSNFGRIMWGGCATKNVACSRDAGKHLFGNRPFDVINNGIDIERFRFSDEKRRQARAELGVDSNTTLIGNIGRINSQKNPLFQVKVFAEYIRLDPSAKYLMLGRDDMAIEVLELAEKLGVKGSIIVHPAVDDTAPYYCALDALLMPSLYEGLGIAKIEAQCAGLPVLYADNMPKEADIAGLSVHRTLKEEAKEWAACLYEMISDGARENREIYAEEIKNIGYSNELTAKEVSIIIENNPLMDGPDKNWRLLSQREIKEEELRLLCRFDSLCCELGLRYSLSGGTLLGAIRHGGFIPWDDDIDIAMPRPDYEKLLEAAEHGKLESDLALIGFPEKTSEPVFMKFQTNHIRCKEYHIKKCRGLWIDVVPYDGLPEESEQVRRIYKKAKLYQRIIIAAESDAKRGRTRLKKAIKRLAVPLIDAFNIEEHCVIELNNLSKSIQFGATPFVGAISWGLYGEGERIPLCSFDGMRMMDFEGKKFPVINFWDEYLTGLYGDYMQLPRVDKRTNHNLIAWRVSD